MPRSPTSTTRVIPNRSLTLVTWLATVMGSPVSPAKTSMATGMPSRGQQAVDDLQPAPHPVLRVADGALRAGPALERGAGHVIQDQGAAARCRAAGASSIFCCRACSQSIAAYRSSSSHEPSPRTSPRELAAVWPRSPRAMASLESGLVTCATAIATTRSRCRDATHPPGTRRSTETAQRRTPRSNPDVTSRDHELRPSRPPGCGCGRQPLPIRSMAAAA